jgi:NDP-sugar pyrophosphorylase family protein
MPGGKVTGVIAAAGYATRLQPLSCSKEILLINGRAVMDYVIERMRIGGCTEIRVVTRPEKTDVIAHAEEIGATVVLDHPATPSESFAAGMAGLEPEDIVLIGWPDTLWEPEDGYVPLVQAVEGGREIALGIFETSDLERSDVLSFDSSGRITGIHIKPAEPPSTWIWGCAAARKRAFAGLEREEWPGSFFNALCQNGVDLHAVPLSEAWLDIGTKEALEQATAGWGA